MRWLATAAKVAIGSMLVLAACSAPRLPDDGSGPGEGSGGPLSPGGTFVSEEGLSVGAPAAALERTVYVTVAEVEPASAMLDLPGAVTPLGPWYRVHAEETVMALEGSGFVLGLPVPEGAASDELAVAVRVPAEENFYDATNVVGGTEEEPGATVTLTDDVAYLRGSYDAGRDLFFVALYELPEDGEEVALVQASTFEPVDAVATVAPADGHPGFFVSCHPELGDDDVPESCRSVDILDAIVALEQAYDDFTGLGFREPRMYRQPITVGYASDGSPVVRPGPWVMTLRACSQTGNTAGKYTGSANATSTWSCVGTSGVTAGVIDTIRHEYFHATQWAYPAVRTSFQYWLTESTASVAQNSLGTMVRDTGRPVRDVDVRLLDGGQKYATQDFWIYLGLRHGLGIDYLIPVFEEGGNQDAANTIIGRDFAAYGDLGDAYWAWAKNQAFEKSVALGGDGFATLCALDTDDRDRHYALDIHDDNPLGSPITWTYTGEAPLADQVLGIPPLTSRVIRVNAQPWVGGPYTVRFEVLAASDVRVKAYLPQDEGTTACVTRSEARQHTVSVSTEPTYLHLLIVNTSATAAYPVTIDMPYAGPPEIEIVGPADGVVDEGEEAFEAVVGGFQGADADDLTVRWYADLDGVTTLVGTSESGEVVALALCDGQYAVTAEVHDPFTATTRSDTIPVTVARSDTPPDACLPTVEIVEPRSVFETTYLEGEAIPLEAIVDEDPPEYPVIWRRGSLDGTIIGQGLQSSTKLPAGNHYVYVSYGPVYDSVYMRVVDGTNALPSADITTPAADLTIPWEEVEPTGCRTTVALEGGGWDAEDGDLSGDSLLWRYQSPPGGTLWYGLGTGTTSSIVVQCGSSYRVQLQATDSATQRGTDEVDITVEAPLN